MLGRRDPQGRLSSASAQLGEAAVASMGFYAKVATEGQDLFSDSEFASLYCADNGRPSAPPSLLALARLLQHYEGISDAEVVERCRFDLRWKVALDLDLASVEAPFAKSTYQAFRARLTLHEKEGMAFERSVGTARQAGLLPRKLRVAVDSSPVRGRGAVKDTFNLLSDAVAKVVRAVAAREGTAPEEVARRAGLSRHLEAPSVKGSEPVDWSDPAGRDRFLAGLVADCDRAVALAKRAGCATEEADLLNKVVAQDVDREGPEGPSIRRGVAPGRTVSVHDPEARHGHKSHGKGYTGHKAHLAVEATSGVITAVDVSAPGEADGALVEILLTQTADVTGRDVAEALGDSAYSSRTALEAAGRFGVELITKMPGGRSDRFGPDAFRVSADGTRARCPAGAFSARVQHRRDGLLHVWSPEQCGPCPLKERCTSAASRTLLVAPEFHERRRRERYARSKKGRRRLRRRVAVEHAIGRLKNLGAGTARYFGRAKTKSQWLWTAAVANLSLAWSRRPA